MEDVYLEQVHTFGSVGRHPSGRVITTAYYSLIDIKHHKLQLNQNELHWHSVHDIKKLAFDHKKILDTCLNRLREQNAETLALFAAADLDTPVPVPQEVPWFPKDVANWSVRWVAMHLVEELTRHAGHCDIIRESIDGATMYELMAGILGWPETDWIKPWRKSA